MIDKSFAYSVLDKGMYFPDKGSPSNFNFLDISLLALNCPNSSCDFGNHEYVFCINVALFCNIFD